MTNPLRKERVKKFVERFPHDSGFQLLDLNRSIIVRPGDEGEVGDPNIADEFARCSVGLTGTDGNPKDFNALLTMWNDPEDRKLLNPIALMRLWASIYRTYFGWVKRTRRLFPTQDSSLSLITRGVDSSRDYKVVFRDGTGTVSSWNPSNNSISGSFVEGYLARGQFFAPKNFTFFSNSLIQTAGRLIQNVTGTYTQFNDTTINTVGYTVQGGKPVDQYFNGNSTTESGLAGSPSFAIPFQTSFGVSSFYNVESSTTPVEIKEVILTNKEKTLPSPEQFGFTDGEPPTNITPPGYVLLNKPYNLIAPMSVGPYTVTIEFDEPTAFDDILFPTPRLEVRSPITATISSFVLRSSIDGITYDEELNFGDYYNAQNDPDFTNNLSDNLFILSDNYYSLDNKNNFNLNSYSTRYTKNRPIKVRDELAPSELNWEKNLKYFYYPDGDTEDFAILNEEDPLPNKTPSGRPFNAYISQVKDANWNNHTYSGVPTYSKNQSIVGHTAVSVPIVKNGISQTATFRAYYSNSFHYLVAYRVNDSTSPFSTSNQNWKVYDYKGDPDIQEGSGLTPLSLRVLSHNSGKSHKENRRWELIDEDGELIKYGYFNFNISNPTRYVKKIEIEYGANDASLLTQRFIGYHHPVVRGVKQTTGTSSTSNFLGYNQVDFNDNFYTDTNPELYTLSSYQVNDLIAQNSFLNLDLSNLLKWKLLPYTLPYNTPLLRTALNNIDFVLTDLEVGFEPDEDYLDNTMLRLPADEAELNEHITLSLQLNKDPVTYWFRLRCNELLNELVSYCKNTCLKFWRISPVFSVSNYLDYTELNLDIQPETRDIRSIPLTVDRFGELRNTAIQTYLISSGAVDIENSTAAGQLWFLSGGGYTSVDLASNILSEFIDNILLEGKAGNTPENPNLI